MPPWVVVLGALLGVLVAAGVVALLFLPGAGQDLPGDAGAGSPSTSAAATVGASVAATRDEARRAAEDIAVTLATLDADGLDAGLDRWEQVSTSPLLETLRERRSEVADDTRRAGTTTTAVPSSAAVSRLTADSADVLVVLRVTVSSDDGDPVVSTRREVVTVVRVDGGWRAGALTVQDPG